MQTNPLPIRAMPVFLSPEDEETFYTWLEEQEATEARIYDPEAELQLDCELTHRPRRPRAAPPRRA